MTWGGLESRSTAVLPFLQQRQLREQIETFLDRIIKSQ